MVVLRLGYLCQHQEAASQLDAPIPADPGITQPYPLSIRQWITSILFSHVTNFCIYVDIAEIMSD